MKETIVSGIRATGRLHVGNYLGALNEFVKLQNENKGRNYFFIADLHALTTPFEPKDLTENTYQVVAEYLAAGIDPEKSTFFLQNHVLEHAELAWIFNCILPLGELERMTQFKDKSRQHKTNINAGLLTYPALMAADILIYKPSAVPVGDDQSQHVELSRLVARRFNSRFGETFPEPKTYLQKPLRIMSLKDPEKKMNKTGDEALMLDDSPEDVMKKMKKAVTATGGADRSPGVDNLFTLLEHFGDDVQKRHFKQAQKDGTLKFGELKESLANLIAGHFSDFREKKAKLLDDRKQLDEILADGASKAREDAKETLDEVKGKLGLA